ncbi:MAG TPA: hypothetical protein VE974_23130 [Thermoanaerobaculia bacterium]|nr:hypothetical protein [Thermoanaerobaculia bacterium]
MSALAASLLSELARSAVEAERRQRSVYAELAAEVAVPPEIHEERASGGTVEQQQAIAEAQLARFGLRTVRGRKDQCIVDEAARTQLREVLGGLVACVDGVDLGLDDVLASPAIDRRTLLAFITAGLKRDARWRYLQTQTLLQDGLPRATISGGRLLTKVILGTDEHGEIVARLANDASVEQNDSQAVSALTFEFTVGAFPSIR